MAEICVIGLGYVGLPTASLLANSGFQVLGVDKDHDVVESLKSGKTRLQETGLATLVSAAVHSGNLTAATQPEESDTFIICVPTPITENKTADLNAVKHATGAIRPYVRKGNLVILESTSPVGTTVNVVGKILSETGLVPGEDFDLCYCPERVLPGNTVGELVNNDRIIGGVTIQSAQRAKEIYDRFSVGEKALTDTQTAEMCKLMENTYRDVNIALANVFSNIAEESGVDVWKAIEFANLHPRVNILNPGPGVGGHCIPVDPWFLIEDYPTLSGLLSVARQVNDGQAKHILDKLKKAGLKSGDALAILGASYKPDIDDPRESPAFLLAETAREAGMTVRIHDPHVTPGTYHDVDVTGDLTACLTGATAAVLVTNHKEYRSLSSKIFSETMTGRIILDSRNWLNHSSLKFAGFDLIALGRGE